MGFLWQNPDDALLLPRVLDVGCGSGDLLAALRPSLGVGLDLSARAVETARQRHGGGAPPKGRRPA